MAKIYLNFISSKLWTCNKIYLTPKLVKLFVKYYISVEFTDARIEEWQLIYKLISYHSSLTPDNTDFSQSLYFFVLFY